MVSEKDRDQQEKATRGEILTLAHKIQKLLDGELEGPEKAAARRQLALHFDTYKAKYKAMCEIMGLKVGNRKTEAETKTTMEEWANESTKWEEWFMDAQIKAEPIYTVANELNLLGIATASGGAAPVSQEHL